MRMRSFQLFSSFYTNFSMYIHISDSCVRAYLIQTQQLQNTHTSILRTLPAPSYTRKQAVNPDFLLNSDFLTDRLFKAVCYTCTILHACRTSLLHHHHHYNKLCVLLQSLKRERGKRKFC